MAAIFKSILPGLLASSGGEGGILSGIKDFAGRVLSDLGSGRVSSGGEFGKSLARAGARALGIAPKNAADEIDVGISSLANGIAKNAADDDIIIQKAEPQIHRVKSMMKPARLEEREAVQRQGPTPNAPAPKGIKALKFDRIESSERRERRHRKKKKGRK